MTRSVLVTGAGTGLGLETACLLAERGFTVYGAVIDSGQQEHLAAEAARRRVKVEVLSLDVTDARSIHAAVRAIVDRSGGIYGLVNNAGISLRGYFEDTEDDEIRRTFDVNLFGSMAVTREVLPYMRRAGRGRLIFVSSVGARIASMARTAYCASKFAVEGFAESLMQEVAPLGVKVSIVEPGIVKTERWTTNRGVARRALDSQSPYLAWFRREEALADELVRTSPTTPRAVAEAIARALTDEDPRLRYLVGRRAKIAVALRRYVPGELFERLYFGEAMRRVTGSRRFERARPEVVPTRAPTSSHRPLFGGVPAMHSLLRVVKVLGVRPTVQSSKGKRLSNETIRGFYTTRVIIALINVGLFDELERHQSVNLESFAASEDLDINLLEALCSYLFELRILRRDGANYALETKGRLIIRTLKGPLTIVYAYEDVFYNIEALLKREKHYGVDVTRRGEYVATGSGAVGKLLAFPMVADVIKRNNYARVLDLGCGDGAFLTDLCERNGVLTAYGLDISPEAVAAGKRKLAQKALQGRIHLFVGDIFNVDAAAGATRIEAATCIYVLHEFLRLSRCKTLDLLRKFKSSFPGVPLIICEVIRHTPDELRRKPGGLMEIQLFHDLSNQSLFSRQEWQSVFQEAGFANIREDYLDAVRTCIYTVS